MIEPIVPTVVKQVIRLVLTRLSRPIKASSERPKIELYKFPDETHYFQLWNDFTHSCQWGTYVNPFSWRVAKLEVTRAEFKECLTETAYKKTSKGFASGGLTDSQDSLVYATPLHFEEFWIHEYCHEAKLTFTIVKPFRRWWIPKRRERNKKLSF